MLSPKLFTLLTDFGTTDSYVAQMKAVLLRGTELRCQIVDITHDIRPHDIQEAAFVLFESYSQFPAGTIHVAVVDPGVGSDRRRILARLKHHGDSFVIAPDNGLLSVLLSEEQIECAWEISSLELLAERKKHSSTFDGRDVFAPTAVFVAGGGNPKDLGSQLELRDLVALPECRIVRFSGEAVGGSVVRIDRFGNAISNIVVGETPPAKVNIGGLELPLVSSYAEIDGAAALVGSSSFLEISCNKAKADEKLSISLGEQVEALSEY